MSIIEQMPGSRVKLTIEVSLETWQEALNQAFEEKRKDVKVDGFRPGKLPKNQYISRFGYQSLYEKAMDYVINQTYPQALVEHKVPVIAHPEVDLEFEQLTPDAGFVYTAIVDVYPAIELGDYQGLRVKTLSAVVTDDDVENEIKMLLQSKVENVIKEDAAENGDTTIIDFEGFIDDVAFEGGKGQNYELELGSNSFIPGFEEQLVGMKAGDTKDIFVKFPENYHAEMAGKDARFNVTVHEVKNKVYPKWSDEAVLELAIDDVKTVDEHREYLIASLSKEKQRQYDEHLLKSLIEAFTALAKLEVPQSMIDEQVKRMRENIEQQAQQYNIPMEVYLQYMGLTEDDFTKQAHEIASKRIREDLVMSEFIKVQAIEVNDDDKDALFAELAEENKLEVEKLKTMVDPEEIVSRVKFKKAMELLKAKAHLE